MSERLIVFTRYPEPGKTKRRLIPALGPGGAAELQREMTAHTFGRVRQWSRRDGVAAEVAWLQGKEGDGLCAVCTRFGAPGEVVWYGGLRMGFRKLSNDIVIVRRHSGELTTEHHFGTNSKRETSLIAR